ncbi:hypothetical protein J6590_052820 [Homalodisca vitripennis]|nr:hypothetical protein J6590_052820 [Homalodisca vitripennis]
MAAMVDHAGRCDMDVVMGCDANRGLSERSTHLVLSNASGRDGIRPVCLQRGLDILLICEQDAFVAFRYIPLSIFVVIMKQERSALDRPKSFRPICLSSFLLKTKEKTFARFVGRDISWSALYILISMFTLQEDDATQPYINWYKSFSSCEYFLAAGIITQSSIRLQTESKAPPRSMAVCATQNQYVGSDCISMAKDSFERMLDDREKSTRNFSECGLCAKGLCRSKRSNLM